MMPLQVAAEILLSASPCPEEMTMVMDESGGSEAMPCCPDVDDSDTLNPCKTAKSCHLCKTPVQVNLYTSASFFSLSSLSAHSKTRPLNIAVFNPASIWRPPNAS
ncbi:hypothetical protein [Cellvibrio sp. QJXJ]|uniref:hypothetical protein n=1 Tax=Cellvibrio sp. QJXJ TaxID=2964606 RepID=UPI0021C401F6|nr:hypothetical protein [Cellvibrio sp. QJXJ]UUA74962.1 hypothetical protein NNX04_21110 [Cellvibrio sp. QJXJ]